ncbi:hypothetical protein [Pseudonocardia acidicola]|uniref:Uncharacterized protein n=1 Tax=Pseudonocardia acidicola TaxID=2724939 RepID=A0ABX1SAY1_9PSEU|nr:hypothetical protein [Pseudonocardia acidicola]NMH98706.1 hypothetical protein [Pseudonocardia acidicola]
MTSMPADELRRAAATRVIAAASAVQVRGAVQPDEPAFSRPVPHGIGYGAVPRLPAGSKASGWESRVGNPADPGHDDSLSRNRQEDRWHYLSAIASPT